jgi:hypothetical protein
MSESPNLFIKVERTNLLSYLNFDRLANNFIAVFFIYETSEFSS